jgi:hypothetical protein
MSALSHPCRFGVGLNTSGKPVVWECVTHGGRAERGRVYVDLRYDRCNVARRALPSARTGLAQR